MSDSVTTGWRNCSRDYSRWYELGEEGHASSDIEQKIRSFRVLNQFFDQRLAAQSGE